MKNKFFIALVIFGTGYQYHRHPTYDVKNISHEIQAQNQIQKSITSKPEMVLGEITNENGDSVTPEQVTMTQKSFSEANQVIQSDCFKSAILTGTFTENNGLSNEQIYGVLAANTITTGVQFFYGSFMQNYIYKTMGYDQGDGVVYANTFFIDTPELLGSLDLHEGEGHQQGFHHYQVFSTSIPYQFNDFFDLCLGKP